MGNAREHSRALSTQEAEVALRSHHDAARMADEMEVYRPAREVNRPAHQGARNRGETHCANAGTTRLCSASGALHAR
jgi:hypothetical protein